MIDEKVEASRRMVCLGFDCMRVALGMDPQHYDLEQIRVMLGQRIEDRYAANAPAQAMRSKQAPGDAGK